MSLMQDYIRVSRSRKCPICGHKDWCLLSRDGATAICPRVDSDKVIGEAGFLHRLGEVVADRKVFPKYEPPKKEFAADFDFVHRVAVSHLDADRLNPAAEDLGISADSLLRMGIGWHSPSRAFSFPMRDENYKIIGIRLRKHGGPKFAVTGSKNGLFIPHEMAFDRRLFIVEGPTDCGAMLDLGFEVIGRPSCSTCVDATVEFCKEIGIPVVIVSDRDPYKKHPTRGVWQPGQEGNIKLATELVRKVREVKVIMPPVGKDTRQWLKEGATSEEINDAVSSVERWSA